MIDAIISFLAKNAAVFVAKKLGLKSLLSGVKLISKFEAVWDAWHCIEAVTTHNDTGEILRIASSILPDDAFSFLLETGHDSYTVTRTSSGLYVAARRLPSGFVSPEEFARLIEPWKIHNPRPFRSVSMDPMNKINRDKITRTLHHIEDVLRSSEDHVRDADEVSRILTSGRGSRTSQQEAADALSWSVCCIRGTVKDIDYYIKEVEDKVSLSEKISLRQTMQKQGVRDRIARLKEAGRYYASLINQLAGRHIF